jgi:hypothetical protein
MRGLLKRYGIVIMLGFMLLACSKVPRGILSEKKMQAVQTDMQIAEAMISENHDNFQDDVQKNALYESVFRKHGITQADYDTALVCMVAIWIFILKYMIVSWPIWMSEKKR